MIVLSVDSSSLVTTVALLKDEFVLGEYTLNFKREHSVILMEKIEMLLNDCQIDISEVDGFVVSKGPGSFTGLRIGMATIKGLSMGANKPYVSISSLDALASALGFFTSAIFIYIALLLPTLIVMDLILPAVSACGYILVTNVSLSPVIALYILLWYVIQSTLVISSLLKLLSTQNPNGRL